MSNYDYLRDHALKNVWCSPEQDTQYIIKPAKVSKVGGVKKAATVLSRSVNLPDESSLWNVYQIGQIHPLVLGLFPVVEEWVSFATTSIEQKMVVDIYTDDGLQLPRFQTWYKYNEDKNLIVAVKRNDKIAFDFNKDDVFIRVYSNEYFNTLRSNHTQDIIHVQGGVFTTNQQIVDFQTLYNSYVAKDGFTYAFVNGIKVEAISLLSVKIDDVAEFVHDSSIYKIIDFKVGDLNDFHSTLDLKKKYLLHYAGPDNGVIDYQDDIDVFILQDLGSSRHRGVYYHKNTKDALRNLTHRDYSVVAPYVARYASKIEKTQTALPVIDPNSLYVRLHIRKSGYSRPLVFEHNRVHELYKMSEVNILRAMLGIDSTVSNWRADVLEAAGYTEVMRSRPNEVTIALVEKAYGYNAISKFIGDTPSATYAFSQKVAADVPYGLQNGATAYEYGANGELIGWHLHEVGSRYICVSNDAKHVEFISGRGSDHLDEFYNSLNTPVNTKNDFRVYMCKSLNGSPDNKFVDVTGDLTKYSYLNGRVIWTDPSPANYPLVRTNAKFIAHDLEIATSGGSLKFNLTSQQKRGTTWSNWIMHVPLGEIDVFLNNKLLIRDLDYVVRFPEVQINNKHYLANPDTATQKIHVRHMGFCTKKLELSKEGDSGFIEHGVMSNNNKFDLRDDKVLRIIVNGQLKTRQNLVFSEQHSGVSVIDALNGQPYAIRDIVVPTRGLTNASTYALRDISTATDKVVSDYLTLKIPQPPRPAPVAVPQRYVVVSPFCNKIIYDIKTATLVLENKVYKDAEIFNLCKPYETLLKFDPTQEEQKVDDRFVVVHPHNLGASVEFDANQYRFMERVVKLYTNGLVTLSSFIIIP